jgi:hypothetical protein
MKVSVDELVDRVKANMEELTDSFDADIVMTAFKASAYASYRIDDIHVIQKAEGLSYEFELEQGDRDITILFNEEGILVSPTH